MTGDPIVFDSLSLPDIDSENGDMSTVAQFEAGADLDEGVSGRKRIDTTYENFSEDIVERPRSGEEAPQPADLYTYPHRRY